MRMSFLTWSSLISELGKTLRCLFEEAERLLLCRRLAGYACLYDAMSRRILLVGMVVYFEFKLRLLGRLEELRMFHSPRPFYSW